MAERGQGDGVCDDNAAAKAKEPDDNDGGELIRFGGEGSRELSFAGCGALKVVSDRNEEGDWS